MKKKLLNFVVLSLLIIASSCTESELPSSRDLAGTKWDMESFLTMPPSAPDDVTYKQSWNIEITFFEIDHTGIQELEESRFMKVCDGKNKVYLMDLQLENRSELSEELKAFNIDKDCFDFAQNPSDHIRFEIIENVTYGEQSLPL